VSNTAIPDSNGGETHCPVCERTRPARKLRRRLYDVPVCNKCRNAFANRRQAAYLIDTLVWGLVISLPLTYLEHFFYGNALPPGFPLLRYLGLDTALGFVASWILPLFFFCKDGFHGMSLGKWLMGVQVVDVHTREPVGFGRSFKRNLVLLSRNEERIFHCADRDWWLRQPSIRRNLGSHKELRTQRKWERLDESFCVPT